MAESVRSANSGEARGSTERENVVRPLQWQGIEFVASLAHDMRSPLATITTSAELLEQDLMPTDSAHLIAIIQRQAGRLQQMIQDLSESMSAGEKDSYLRTEETDDLRDTIREVSSELQCVQSGHKLNLDLPDAPVPASVDVEKVRRILHNLLRNALTYSPANTIVTTRLRVQPDKDSVVIEVEDQGPGVPKSARQDVFKRFYRLDRSSHPEGQGLGLYIVQRLADAHGGLAWVETGKDGGALFRVSLPI